MEQGQTELYAQYFKGDVMVAQNRLKKSGDLTADVEKMKPKLTRPFTVVLVKLEVITVHTYLDKI
jgi:hypothetical protein